MEKYIVPFFYQILNENFPIAMVTRGWLETGFLRKLLVTARKLKKTRFLRLGAGGQKPGFYENSW